MKFVMLKHCSLTTVKLNFSIYNSSDSFGSLRLFMKFLENWSRNISETRISRKIVSMHWFWTPQSMQELFVFEISAQKRLVIGSFDRNQHNIDSIFSIHYNPIKVATQKFVRMKGTINLLNLTKIFAARFRRVHFLARTQ